MGVNKALCFKKTAKKPSNLKSGGKPKTVWDIRVFNVQFTKMIIKLLIDYWSLALQYTVECTLNISH